VYHRGSHTTGKGSDFAVENGHRNLVWCYFQNMPGWLLWLHLPEHLVVNLFYILYIGAKGQLPAIFKAKWMALLGLPHFLKSRKAIQRRRTASVREIRASMSRGLLRPYLLGITARRMARQAAREAEAQQ
jgi:GT2 family glycosyltransferase